ncbi:DUF6463 family protein [Vitiosangium sp. GDMCC 1.1324]|uniref:DUF6463 family protein n=1 Tax=Vitiosangium sp. (strain GDMCC 1.1324) TaxID=2138576 RepID=UPI000D363552|nr:DUF6463 family protein [Vitiosangium sp. GDMCC 1.1324]PTL79671.1 hypothetical protein DAT35_33250 [Vitiosangium sp. GDMCC 1.1324]
MRITTGTLLMLTGVLHEVVGVILFRGPLAEMLRAGVFNSVGDDSGPRAAAFWFLVSGCGFVLFGWLCRWVELELARPLPAGLGWGLVMLGVACVVPMPITGAWLFFPLGIRVLLDARQRTVLPEVLRPFASGADHVDVKTVETDVSLREFIARFMSWQPAWVSALYRVRGVFVRLLGLRQIGVPRQTLLLPEDVPMQQGAAAAFFTVRQAEEERVWVVSAEDSHLEAFLAVSVEPGGGQQRRFHVATIVRYRNWAGPVYFNVIRPFHHLVVGGMVRSAARALPG